MRDRLSGEDRVTERTARSVGWVQTIKRFGGMHPRSNTDEDDIESSKTCSHRPPEGCAGKSHQHANQRQDSAEHSVELRSRTQR